MKHTMKHPFRQDCGDYYRLQSSGIRGSEVDGADFRDFLAVFGCLWW